MNKKETKKPKAITEPAEKLIERFPEGVCLFFSPKWCGNPQIKIIQLDGVDGNGNPATLYAAANKNGNPGYAKSQLDKFLDSPYLFLVGRQSRIIQHGDVICHFETPKAALESFLPPGFELFVTEFLLEARKAAEIIKKHFDQQLENSMISEIEHLEMAIIPDWRLWGNHCPADNARPVLFKNVNGEKTPITGCELMSHLLTSKLLRLGYGIREQDCTFIVVNIKDEADFSQTVVDLARFSGVPQILIKSKDQNSLQQLDLTTGEEISLTDDISDYFDDRLAADLKKFRPGAVNDPRTALINAFCTSTFRKRGLFGKMMIDRKAEEFDLLYKQEN